jgi:hypothetical protein
MARVPLEPIERARLAGGGRLVLARQQDTPLIFSQRSLSDIGIRVLGASETRSRIELSVTQAPQWVEVDLRSAARDKPGTVRAFDLAERNGHGRLVGGTTFITLAQP